MTEVQSIILMAAVICLSVYAMYIFATSEDGRDHIEEPEKYGQEIIDSMNG